jgi:hypothetical protein
MAYSEQEKRAAWQALYVRFGELPVPEKRVNEVQCDLTRAKELLERVRSAGDLRACVDPHSRLYAEIAAFLAAKPVSAPQEKKS